MSDPNLIDQASQPSSSNPTTTPTPTAPVNSQSIPNTQNTPSAVRPANDNPASSLHARIYDNVLKTLGGGDAMIDKTMPDGTVQRVKVPQSRTTMSRGIVAGALAGMFAPSSYRETPYGPVRDFGTDASNAFNAGQDKKKQMTADAQKQADDLESRRLRNFDNNAKMIQQGTAMALQKHSVLDPTAKANQAGIIASAEEADQRRDPSDPEVFYGRGMNVDAVTGMLSTPKGKYKTTDTNVVVDGTVDVVNPHTGVTEVHPTYAVLNPDAKLKVTKDQADELAKFNSGFKNAFELTGGNLNLTAQQYTKATHLANTLRLAEDFYTRLVNNPDLKELGLKPVDLVEAFRKDPKGLSTAIDAGEAAMATTDLPYKIIQKVAGSDNGAKLLGLFGDGAANKLVEYARNAELEDFAAKKEAENKGTFAGKGITSEPIAQRIMADPNASPELKAQAQTYLDNVVTQAGKKSGAVAGGKTTANLTQIKAVAHNIVTGDLANLADVVSRSGTEKQAMVGSLHDEAVARGLDPNDYSVAALKSKAETYDDYHSTKGGKTTRSNLNSFDTFLQHAGEAKTASDRLRTKMVAGSSIPLANKPLNWLAKNITGDTDVKAFRDSLVPVRKEYMSFLNANRAEHEADIKAMDVVLDDNSSPDQITQTMRDLAMSADARVSAMGRTYLATMGTTFPDLLSPVGKQAIQSLVGPTSASLALSVRLPQGNDQVLSDKNVINQYFKTAGGDPALAVKLARSNGWYVPSKDGKNGPPVNPPQAAPQQ